MFSAAVVTEMGDFRKMERNGGYKDVGRAASRDVGAERRRLGQEHGMEITSMT